MARSNVAIVKKAEPLTKTVSVGFRQIFHHGSETGGRAFSGGLALLGANEGFGLRSASPMTDFSARGTGARTDATPAISSRKSLATLSTALGVKVWSCSREPWSSNLEHKVLIRRGTPWVC